MSTVPSIIITTITDVRALAAAVRAGELSHAQREALAMLLYSVVEATALAPRAQQRYPDNDTAALGYLIGAWEPVTTAWAELVATLRSSGARHIA